MVSIVYIYWPIPTPIYCEYHSTLAYSSILENMQTIKLHKCNTYIQQRMKDELNVRLFVCLICCLGQWLATVPAAVPRAPL